GVEALRDPPLAGQRVRVGDDTPAGPPRAGRRRGRLDRPRPRRGQAAQEERERDRDEHREHEQDEHGRGQGDGEGRARGLDLAGRPSLPGRAVGRFGPRGLVGQPGLEAVAGEDRPGRVGRLRRGGREEQPRERERADEAWHEALGERSRQSSGRRAAGQHEALPPSHPARGWGRLGRSGGRGDEGALRDSDGHSMRGAVPVFIAPMLAWLAMASPVRAQERDPLPVPDLPGWKTLKGDFHLHTVFSDGEVWPTVHVREAWRDGLDVIALTDHVEYRPHGADVGLDLRRPYELARPLADELGLILVQGVEITRPAPGTKATIPVGSGHFNALFVTDPKALEVDDLQEALRRARAQGAFVIWDHPGFMRTLVPEWHAHVDEA